MNKRKMRESAQTQFTTTITMQRAALEPERYRWKRRRNNNTQWTEKKKSPFKLLWFDFSCLVWNCCSLVSLRSSYPFIGDLCLGKLCIRRGKSVQMIVNQYINDCHSRVRDWIVHFLRYFFFCFFWFQQNEIAKPKKNIFLNFICCYT